MGTGQIPTGQEMKPRKSELGFYDSRRRTGRRECWRLRTSGSRGSHENHRLFSEYLGISAACSHVNGRVDANDSVST
jgi:hypothetical protein